MSDHDGRHARFGHHGLGPGRGGRPGRVTRWSCGRASQASADAMVTGHRQGPRQGHRAWQGHRGRAQPRSSAASRPPISCRAWPTATSSSSRSSRTWPSRRRCSPSSSGSSSPAASSPPTRRTLPVVELAMVTQRPEQVCGIHFFNPAPAMKLVEVVRPLTASDETIATATAFAAACGKDAVEVQRPRRLHRQRAAVPVPEQRGAHVRAGHGLDGVHRHRDEGRLQLPDGPVRAARPGRASTRRWPSSTRCTPSSATRTTRRCPRCAAWCRPATSAARPSVASSRTELTNPAMAWRHRSPARLATMLDDRGSVAVRMPIEPRASRWQLPDPDAADEHGLCGVGADLEPGTLLAAYRAGCSRCRCAAGWSAGGRPTRAASCRSTG